MRVLTTLALALTLALLPGTATAMEFNPPARLDTSQIDDLRTLVTPCSTDTDCVIKNPHIIPNQYTIRAYLLVHGDNVQFPTNGDCTMVDWLSQDGDGQPFIPVDLNANGAIDCDSDLELGA